MQQHSQQLPSLSTSIPLLPNNSSGSSSAYPHHRASANVEENRSILNAYIYDYLYRSGFSEAAAGLLKDCPDIPVKPKSQTLSDSSKLPGEHAPEDTPTQNNGQEDSASFDSAYGSNKSDNHQNLTLSPLDRSTSLKRRLSLPEPNVRVVSERSFLLEWWHVFYDMFKASRGQDASEQTRLFLNAARQAQAARMNPQVRSSPEQMGIHTNVPQSAGGPMSASAQHYPSAPTPKNNTPAAQPQSASSQTGPQSMGLQPQARPGEEQRLTPHQLQQQQQQAMARAAASAMNGQQGQEAGMVSDTQAYQRAAMAQQRRFAVTNPDRPAQQGNPQNMPPPSQSPVYRGQAGPYQAANPQQAMQQAAAYQQIQAQQQAQAAQAQNNKRSQSQMQAGQQMAEQQAMIMQQQQQLAAAQMRNQPRPQSAADNHASPAMTQRVPSRGANASPYVTSQNFREQGMVVPGSPHKKARLSPPKEQIEQQFGQQGSAQHAAQAQMQNDYARQQALAAHQAALHQQQAQGQQPGQAGPSNINNYRAQVSAAHAAQMSQMQNQNMELARQHQHAVQVHAQAQAAYAHHVQAQQAMGPPGSFTSQQQQQQYQYHGQAAAQAQQQAAQAAQVAQQAQMQAAQAQAQAQAAQQQQQGQPMPSPGLNGPGHPFAAYGSEGVNRMGSPSLHPNRPGLSNEQQQNLHNQLQAQLARNPEYHAQSNMPPPSATSSRRNTNASINPPPSSAGQNSGQGSPTVPQGNGQPAVNGTGKGGKKKAAEERKRAASKSKAAAAAPPPASSPVAPPVQQTSSQEAAPSSNGIKDITVEEGNDSMTSMSHFINAEAFGASNDDNVTDPFDQFINFGDMQSIENTNFDEFVDFGNL